MPYKPGHPCGVSSCPNLAPSGRSYCPVHEKERMDEWSKAQRPDKEIRKLYGYEWRKRRKAFIEAHPYCEECRRNGRLVPAKVVDHLVPHKGDPAIFWDESKWESKCEPCHNRKTASQDGGFRNPRRDGAS